MLEIKDSSIHGRGVFAQQEFQKGQVIYTSPNRSILSKPIHPCAWIGKDQYISEGNFIYWINHSCEPNAVVWKKEGIVLITLRKILPGEEITYNYNLSGAEGEIVPCSCSAKLCRGSFNTRYESLTSVDLAIDINNKEKTKGRNKTNFR